MKLKELILNEGDHDTLARFLTLRSIVFLLLLVDNIDQLLEKLKL